MKTGGIASIFASEPVDGGAPAKKKHKGQSTTSSLNQLVSFLPAFLM